MGSHFQPNALATDDFRISLGSARIGGTEVRSGIEESWSLGPEASGAFGRPDADGIEKKDSRGSQGLGDRSTNRRESAPVHVEFGISLGIPRIAPSRKNVDGRVRYFDERTGKWVIPEELVLGRWRCKKTRARVVFKGARLPPGTWQAVLQCLARGVGIHETTPAALQSALGQIDAERGGAPPLRRPNIECLLAMGAYLKRRNALREILMRHLNVDPSSPGIPNLFLYRLEPDGRVTGARFVEVKRPKEPLLKSQIDELRFLRGLGLKAGVVRLVERD